MIQLARPLRVLLAAGLVAACSDSNDDAENGADSSEAVPLTPAAAEGTSALPVSLGPPECDQCLSDRCGDEAAACTANSACTDLLVCVSGCSSQPEPNICFVGCMMAAGTPPDEFFALLNCLPVQCETECGSRATED